MRPAWIAAALALLTLAAYSSVSSFEFSTFDDPQYVVDNPRVNQGLSRESVAWAFTTGHASNWHPLTWLSHMLDAQLFGMRAGYHHWVSVLLHVANTLLLMAFLVRTTGAVGRSAFVAALFALHPLHVESVAWIAERKDVLSTLFFMLTLLFYQRYARAATPARYLPVFACLALGLMAKPMLVTLPFVLLLLDVWPLGRYRPGEGGGPVLRLVAEKLPLFALAAASSIITFLVQREGGAVSGLELTPLGLRLANALVSSVLYIRNMFWPANLAVMYPMPASIPAWQWLGALLTLLAISYGVLRQATRRPWLAVGWFWYLGTLVPVIGLVQVGTQAMADRYTYIPLIGLFIIVSWGGYDLLARYARPRWTVPLLATLLVAALSAATWHQTRYWSDARTLWQHALEVSRDNYRAHVALGSLLEEEGHNREAAEHFAAALRIEPRYAEAHNKLGVALAALGHPDQALEHYRRALRLNPGLAAAHTNLGNALAAQGRLDGALREYQEALRLNPDDALAANGMGSALDEMGRVDEAITLYRRALDLDPNLAAAHNNLAAAFAKKGRVDEAVAEIRAALRHEPGNASYHYNYAMLLRYQRKPDAARAELESALRIDPNYSAAREALQRLPRAGTGERQP